MKRHRIASFAITGIARYRRSELAARSRGCCRYAPSCSHYAETALRHRALPVALLLILWRVVRCRPSVPRGTYDPVRAPSRTLRRKVVGVLLLSGIVTLGTAGLAQAMVAPQVTAGGCTATINGADIGGFNRNNPLVVDKGDKIQVAGLAPGRFRTASEPAGTTTDFHLTINVVSPYKVNTDTKTTNGYRTFGSTEDVDDYLKYGSGLYRVNAVAQGLRNGTVAYTCLATFYVRLDGSDVPSIVAGVIAIAGLGAAATSGGKSDWAPTDTLPAEPGSPDAAAAEEVAPDDSANRQEDFSELGCLFAILAIFGIGEEDLFFLGAAALPMPGNTEGRRFRRRGHPVRGFVSGVIAGLAITIVAQQQGFWYLTVPNVVILPLALGLLFGWRGWRGRAFKVIPRG